MTLAVICNEETTHQVAVMEAYAWDIGDCGKCIYNGINNTLPGHTKQWAETCIKHIEGRHQPNNCSMVFNEAMRRSINLQVLRDSGVKSHDVFKNPPEGCESPLIGLLIVCCQKALHINDEMTFARALRFLRRYVECYQSRGYGEDDSGTIEEEEVLRLEATAKTGLLQGFPSPSVAHVG